MNKKETEKFVASLIALEIGLILIKEMYAELKTEKERKEFLSLLSQKEKKLLGFST